MHRQSLFSTCMVLAILFLAPRHAPADPPERLNIGGIENLVTTIEIDGDRGISAVAPVGDVDGDGLDDLVLRLRVNEWSPDDEDLILVVYGTRAAPGPLDPLAAGASTTLIRALLGGWTTSQGLAGGEDIDGDGRPDFMVVSGFEGAVGGPAALVILGNANGGRLPREIYTEQIGGEVRGTLIFDGNPTEPDQQMGAVIAMSPDINGDGYGEILIGETAGIFDRRRCFVIFGAAELPRTIDLAETGVSVPGLVIEDSAPPGTRGFGQIAPLGDIDGDGLGDVGFVFVSRKNDPPNGFFDESFFLFGREVFPSSLTIDELPAGFGVRLPRYAHLARGGDVDGDGLEDPILFHEIDQLADGKAYILYGRPRESFPEVIDRDTFGARELGTTIVEPFCISGCLTNTRGLRLTRGRDLDGDGRAEVLLGASRRHLAYGEARLNSAGVVFLLRGDRHLPAVLPSDAIPEGLGVRIDGIEPRGSLGDEVFLLSDFDGDGTGDLVFTSMPRLCAGGRSAANRKVWIVSGAVLDRTAPHIGRFYPEHGPVEGGHSAAIFGTGFDDGTRVRFGAREAEVVAVRGSGIIVVQVPPGAAAGEVPVRVITSRGEAEGELRYRYIEVEKETLFVEGDSEGTLTIRHFDARSVLSRGVATGDFNGDSRTDLALADSHLDFGAEQKLHLVFGSGKRERELELDFLSPPEGVTIDLASTATRLAAGGDINGDGFDDLIVRVGILTDEWRAVLGRAEFPEDSPLEDLPGTVRLSGAALEHFPDAAAIVPDVSGDGIDELLLTTRDELYIVKGRRSFPEKVVLDDLAASGDGAIYETGGVFLKDVAGSAGDFNGDGVLDVFFAGMGKATTGAVVILYGGADMFPGRRVRLEKSLLGDAGGLLLTGRMRHWDGNHFSASVPGDLDGDGSTDLFFNQTNYGDCTLTPASGEGFIFDRETALREGFSEEDSPSIVEQYGSVDIGLPDFSLTGPGVQRGVLTVRSDQREENLGESASPAGDFNGDGYPDLLIGTTGTNAYVVFGGADLFEERLVDLSNPGGRAMTLDGGGTPEVATFAGGGFDWDRDGVGDILLGSSDGQVHLIFGDRAFGNGTAETKFVRGDADGNGGVNLSDGILILGYVFSGGAGPACLDALDVDDDGSVGLTDAIDVLRFLFAGGPAPRPPYPDAGLDPTPDDVLCAG